MHPLLSVGLWDVVSFHYVNHEMMHTLHALYGGMAQCVEKEEAESILIPAPIALEFVCVRGEVEFRSV
jgi:hypothetical protein